MGDMNKLSLREVLKYDPNRAYFDKFIPGCLSTAYGTFKRSQKWDHPIKYTYVTVGNINGRVICRALWNEMSYNPVRFGNVSPFLYKDSENIYNFCRNDVYKNYPGGEIIKQVQYKLINFMTLNCDARGGWRDVIHTDNGRVKIDFSGGMSDNKYKMLAKLRDAIKIIAKQNVEDLKDPVYRSEIMKVVDARHPNGIRSNMKSVQVTDFDDERDSIVFDEDRLDDAEDNARITKENRKYYSFKQYRQACTDLTGVINMRMSENTK